MSPRPFRAKIGFSRKSNGELVQEGGAVVLKMKNNPRFADCPVDIALLEEAVNNLWDSMSAALDGGKLAIETRNAARQPVIQYMRQVTIYAEAKSKGDPETFTATGLIPIATTPSVSGALLPPLIRRLFRGPYSGHISLYIKAVFGAASYTIRYAALEADGTTPGVWKELPVSRVKSAIVISGLTPGVVYAFQVRALGPLGNSDWSDSSTIRCG
jgi:hypothetical protein